MVYSTVFLAFFIIASSSAYVLLENDDPEESIIWPSEFNFNAEVIDLVNAYIETLEVWYSAENNRSRVDYINGTNKIYYVGETDDDLGVEYTIHPMTTEEVKNEIVCVKADLEGEQPDFLPVTDDYEYSHEEQLDGKQVRVWTKEREDEDEELIQTTLYVYRTDYDFDVPVKMVRKGSNLKDGATIFHRITNFKQFGFIVDAADVTLADESDCEEALNTDFKTQIEHLHPHNPVHVNKAFHSYKQHHSKKYKKTENELRRAIFHRNWMRVRAHNRKNLGYKMELNEFADRTAEELKGLTGTRPSPPTAHGSMPFPHTNEELMELVEELPKSYDLRFQGVLGPIKNQGSCGSCWAFTITATVEGALSKANGGRNLDLSEQSLVDCAWGFKNYGCNGGQIDKAYEYVLKHGIPLESQYGEYIRRDGYCNVDNTTETLKIRGFAMVTPRNPEALKLALVKYGPVAVAIHASNNMQLYSSGVFYDIECDGNYPNHGVVVVGYGERDGTPYWIVRNSWGENWGQDGYILMSAVNNNCMLQDTPYYPIV
ncbi:hypothetical protein ABMA28_009229 [Loxostege sticticalis]|uniref:Uncharacterized protein n=2 Tax=Loxostege sticticalis TaxID=481309 RepID=A0ABD0SGF9_LOXSC